MSGSSGCRTDNSREGHPLTGADTPYHHPTRRPTSLRQSHSDNTISNREGRRTDDGQRHHGDADQDAYHSGAIAHHHAAHHHADRAREAGAGHRREPDGARWVGAGRRRSGRLGSGRRRRRWWGCGGYVPVDRSPTGPPCRRSTRGDAKRDGTGRDGIERHPCRWPAVRAVPSAHRLRDGWRAPNCWRPARCRPRRGGPPGCRAYRCRNWPPCDCGWRPVGRCARRSLRPARSPRAFLGGYHRVGPQQRTAGRAVVAVEHGRRAPYRCRTRHPGYRAHRNGTYGRG
jgi:hypothetical protein